MFTLQHKERALQAIRLKKQRMERIEQLLIESDTDDIEFLKEVLGASMNGIAPDDSNHQRPAQQQSMAQKRRQQPRARRSKGGNIAVVVREAIDLLQTGISVQTVQAFMEDRGVQSSAKRPAATIGNIFRSLTGDGVLIQVSPSSGRTPAIYEKAEQTAPAS